MDGLGLDLLSSLASLRLLTLVTQLAASGLPGCESSLGGESGRGDPST